MGEASRKKRLQKTQSTTEVKLSDALVDLCKPFVANWNIPVNEIKKRIAIAATAWNITLFPKEEQLIQLKEVLAENPSLQSDPDLIYPILYIFTNMIERKNKIYPNDNRFVTEYNVEIREGICYVNANFVRANKRVNSVEMKV